MPRASSLFSFCLAFVRDGGNDLPRCDRLVLRGLAGDSLCVNSNRRVDHHVDFGW